MSHLVKLLVGLLLLSGMARAERVLDFGIEPQDGDNFTHAEFRLWAPDGDLKGVLVLLAGWSGSSLDWHKIPEWRKFAAEQNFAILTCNIKGEVSLRSYDDPQYGSGTALLKALSHFGEKLNQPALSQLPLCLFGHSAGGQFAYHFARWKPEQVLAFATAKGGCHELSDAALARKVPGLFIIGQRDEAYRYENMTELVFANRKEQALWCLAIEPNTRHEMAKSPLLAINFFEAVIPQCLNPASPLTLQSIDERAGWLGNLSTKSTLPAANYTSSKITVWLPDAKFSRQWRAFTAAAR